MSDKRLYYGMPVDAWPEKAVKEPDLNVIEVPIGSLGEQNDWTLRLNDEQCSDLDHPWSIRPCAHAVYIRIELRHPESERSNYNEPVTRWTVPRVVEVYTQGGYDMTAVCADCVLDALKNLALGERGINGNLF